MEESEVLCMQLLRLVASGSDLILFSWGSSKDKVRDVGWAALFLSAVHFFSFTGFQGVRLDPICVLSGLMEVYCNSESIGVTFITGGGENSHLSPLRNAWGECKGVTDWVLNPSHKSSSGISGEGSTGRKGSSSLRKFKLFTSLSSSNKSFAQSICKHFTNVNPSFGFLYKKDPG